MSWFWWLITGNLALAFSRILQKKQMNGLEEYSSTFSLIYQIFTGLLLLICASLLGFGIPDFSLAPINWTIAAVTFGIAGLLLFKAFAHAEMSSVSIISTSRILWTMGIAIFLLGETLTLPIIYGTVLIVAGIVVLLYRKDFKLNTGSMYAFLAAMAFGIGLANEPFLLEYYEPVQLLAYEFLIAGVVMVALNWKAATKLKYILGKPSSRSLLLGVPLYAFTSVSILTAYNLGGDLLLITPLSQLGRVFTVVLSVIILNERGNLKRKAIGITLAIIGALVIRML